MFLVVAHHCVAHGGAMGMDPDVNKVVASLILPLGKISFTCFVAISMWFLCESSFKGKRFVRAWLEVLFYSVLMVVVAKLMGGAVSKRDLIGSLLPIGGNTHGFASTYLAFYLMLPLLNKVASSLNRKQVVWIVALLAYLQIFERVFAGLGLANLALHPYMSEPTLFALCYFISLYLRKWPRKVWSRALPMGLLALCTWMIVFLLTWGSWQGSFQGTATMLVALFAVDESSLLYIVGGFLLFLCFNALPKMHIKSINVIASTTFGVLLIHDATFFRSVLWGTIVHAQTWWYSDVYAIRLLGTAAIVFVGCALFDLLRQRFLEKPMLIGFWGGLADKLDGIWRLGKSSSVS